MLRTFTLTVIASWLLAAAVSAQGPGAISTTEFDRLLEEARQAYAKGENPVAIQKLQQAIDFIQQSGAKTLASFLPRAMDGWTANEPQTVTGNWGSGLQSFQWTQASRKYTREKDGLRVNVQITNSPQLIQGQRQMATMFENEQYIKMMNQDPNKKVRLFKKEGWTGWTIIESNGNANGVALSEDVMVTLDVNKGTEEVFTKFWKGVDFDGILKQGGK